MICLTVTDFVLQMPLKAMFFAIFNGARQIHQRIFKNREIMDNIEEEVNLFWIL